MRRRVLCKNRNLSQVITQLFSFLIFPVIDFSGDNLRKYMVGWLVVLGLTAL